MKKQVTAFCLLLILLVTSLAPASADGSIRDLSVSEIRATSAAIYWNCTYKEDQTYILTYHVEGLERDMERHASSNYSRLVNLSPATTYELTVTTQNGGSATTTFTTPYAIDYVGNGYQLVDTGLYKTATGKKDYTELSSLNSKTLPGEVYDYDFHFMFQFSLEETEDYRSIDFTLLLHLPNGDFYSIAETLWYQEESQTVTEYFNLTDTLMEIMSDYDGFPIGEYTLTAYFEGEFAAEMTFEME